MLAVDKSLLNWKIASFKKLSLILHNMVITYSSPEKNNIYTFTSVRDSQKRLTNIPGLLLLI